MKLRAVRSGLVVAGERVKEQKYESEKRLSFPPSHCDDMMMIGAWRRRRRRRRRERESLL